MCGLAFVLHSSAAGVARRSYKYTGLFKDMLIAGAVRGTDSTGVFQVCLDNSVVYGKRALPSGAAVDDPSISAVISDADEAPITVGHVRAATAGKVDDMNAHPFIASLGDEQLNYIIGVHNGTLYGWEGYDHDNKHDVDSSWAFSHLAKEGIEAFKDFYGAFAMLWYDTSSPDTLYLARNDERTLYVVRSKDGSSMIGASEPGMIQWLAQRNSIELESEPYLIDDGYLFSIDTAEEKLQIVMERALPECSWVNKPVRNNATSLASYYGSAYTPSPVTTTLPVPVSPTHDVWDSGKAGVIAAVKECLRKARYSLVTDSVLAEKEDEDTPFEMGPDEPLFRAKEDWYDIEDVPLSEGERKGAMYDGTFGSIVMYEAVTYDEFTNNIVGELKYPDVYKNPLAYVRDVKLEEFSKYEDNVMPMVVVGIRFFSGEKEYILAPLNDKGKEALAV